MSKAECNCDGSEGEFCFICTPSLCKEKTLEAEYVSTVDSYRSLYTEIGLVIENCDCAEEDEKCQRCAELQEILEACE